MDAFEQQAEAIKANPGAYRKEKRIICDRCQPHRTIAVVYVGVDGRRWLWTPAGRGPV